MENVNRSWPEVEKDSLLHLFLINRNNISCEDSVLVMNRGFPRVIIPQKLKEPILRLIHKGHWGIVRGKQLARRYCI